MFLVKIFFENRLLVYILVIGFLKEFIGLFYNLFIVGLVKKKFLFLLKKNCF